MYNTPLLNQDSEIFSVAIMNIKLSRYFSADCCSSETKCFTSSSNGFLRVNLDRHFPTGTETTGLVTAYWLWLTQQPCKVRIIIVKLFVVGFFYKMHKKNSTCTHTNKQLDEDTHSSLHILLFDLINRLQLINAFHVFIKGQLVKDT